jgi:hypothetical protein
MTFTPVRTDRFEHPDTRTYRRADPLIRAVQWRPGIGLPCVLEKTNRGSEPGKPYGILDTESSRCMIVDGDWIIFGHHGPYRCSDIEFKRLFVLEG